MTESMNTLRQQSRDASEEAEPVIESQEDKILCYYIEKRITQEQRDELLELLHTPVQG